MRNSHHVREGSSERGYPYQVILYTPKRHYLGLTAVLLQEGWEDYHVTSYEEVKVNKP